MLGGVVVGFVGNRVESEVVGFSLMKGWIGFRVGNRLEIGNNSLWLGFEG